MATRRIVQLNRMKLVRITVNGKRYTFANLKDAAKHFNLPYQTFYNRLRAGWSVKKAITTPLGNWTRTNYVPDPNVTIERRKLTANILTKAGVLH